MSLVSLPNVEKIPKTEKDILNIQNGIMVQPILDCENLTNIRYTANKPLNFKSDFAIVATVLVNIDDMRLIHDKKLDENMWWGFMRNCGKLFIHHHAKHDRPTYFA